ncbi:MAG: hypothetical protein HY712_04810 [candidate division NC10 bacterium]|nr:hypothetical protein [candidate division NC10 bacterium]
MAHASEKVKAAEAIDLCPCWHQVSADFASMYPGGGYCVAGCHRRIKVMAATTFNEVCSLRYGDCEGYQRVLAEGGARVGRAPHPPRG